MTPDQLVDQWRRGMRVSHAAHYEAAKYFHRMHLLISLPAVIISAMLSTAVFVSFQDSSDPQLRNLMAALSVVTVVLSSLQASLKYGERSERHKAAAVQIGEVRRALEQQLVFGSMSEPETTKLREQWNAADRQAPTIPSRLYEKTFKRVMALGDGPQLPIPSEPK